MRAPHDLDALIDDVLARVELTPSQRARVAADLRDHLQDALASGTPVDAVRTAFGTASTTASLIAENPPPTPSHHTLLRRAAIATGLVACVLATWYVASARRLGSFDPVWRASNVVLDATARVARLRSEAKLQDLDEALDIAAVAASDGSAFGRLVALSIVGDATRHGCIDATRVEKVRPLIAIPPTSRELREWYVHIVAAASAEGTTAVGRSLRVTQAMKGIREPSFSATLLEPLVFARASNPSDVWSRVAPDVDRIVEQARYSLAPCIDRQM
jgi:hypothetical protein